MTVFKAFLQILKRNAGVLIIYTMILIVFSMFSLQTGEATTTFQESRPKIYINNHDSGSLLSKSLVDYMTKKNQLVELDDADESLNDALFYQQVNFAMEVPAEFGAKLVEGAKPEIAIRSAGDYGGSLAEMNLSRYLEVAGAYSLITTDEVELVQQIEQTLGEEVEVELVSELNAAAMSRAAYYYNFLNYPLLVGCIFMICLVLLSFRNTQVAQRIAVGGMSPEKINRVLLLANCLFAFVLWLMYVVISFIVVGKTMLSLNGLWMILNSLVFAFCVTSLAFLIANLVRSRNALNGIVNVVGLGSSFLCGAFVPLQWLPDSVKTIAHALPSYWYIDANNQIQAIEDFNPETIWPVLVNMLVIAGFAIGFIVLTNIVSQGEQNNK